LYREIFQDCNTKDSPGLYLKTPFVESIRKFPKAIMYYDISPSEVLTADKQNMTVDSYVLWRITDPLLFFQSLGSISVAEERLDTLTYNALKNTMGTLAATGNNQCGKRIRTE
jgi:membrane protease subunit HflC